jgi:hypothetical protein
MRYSRCDGTQALVQWMSTLPGSRVFPQWVRRSSRRRSRRYLPQTSTMTGTLKQLSPRGRARRRTTRASALARLRAANFYWQLRAARRGGREARRRPIRHARRSLQRLRANDSRQPGTSSTRRRRDPSEAGGSLPVLGFSARCVVGRLPNRAQVCAHPSMLAFMSQMRSEAELRLSGVPRRSRTRSTAWHDAERRWGFRVRVTPSSSRPAPVWARAQR